MNDSLSVQNVLTQVHSKQSSIYSQVYVNCARSCEQKHVAAADTRTGGPDLLY